MEWLHEGCDSDLSADFLHFGASEFPSKNPFKKCLENRFFFALASRSGFGATISDAVMCSFIVFCNSVPADHIIMAASRLLRAVAALVILLSFAAGSRKSYILLEWLHEGCDSDLLADFLHFGASDFPSNVFFKKYCKIVFFSFWRRDPVLELQFPTPLCVVLLCFAS